MAGASPCIATSAFSAVSAAITAKPNLQSRTFLQLAVENIAVDVAPAVRVEDGAEVLLLPVLMLSAMI